MTLQKQAYIFFIILIVAFTSCNPSVYLTVQRPAEIDLGKDKTLAVGDFEHTYTRQTRSQNIRSERFEEILTTRLVQTNAFQVVDRKNMNAILEEHNLTLSGLVESSSLEVGRLLGPTVLIFGSINKNEYEEEITKREEETEEGEKYFMYDRNGKLTVVTNIRIVDVNTGKIIAADDYSSVKTKKTSSREENPPKISRDDLYVNAVQDISNRLVRKIAPYQENVKVDFEKDRDLPELDLAVSQIRIGDWEQAKMTLRNAAIKDNLDEKAKAKAYYNYGLVLLYDGQYDQSREAFRRAMLLNPKNKKYPEAVMIANREEEQAEELKRQLAD